MPFNKALFIDQTALLAYLGYDEYSNFFDITKEWITSFFDNTSEFDLLVTSDYVIISVAEILYSNKVEYENILKFIQNMIKSSSIEIININQEGFTEACRKIQIYHEILQLKLSLTDATTLYILHSSRIKAILTFNPLLHRLEYLLTHFDFDPDMATSSTRLIYDAKPDIFNENEIKKSFMIMGNEVKPKEAIPLFDLELSGWKIESLKTINAKVVDLKLDYIYEKDITYNRSFPDSVCNLISLQGLEISNNEILNSNDDVLDKISKLTWLKKLDISQNGFKEIPSTLQKLKKKNCEILI